MRPFKMMMNEINHFDPVLLLPEIGLRVLGVGRKSSPEKMGFAAFGQRMKEHFSMVYLAAGQGTFASASHGKCRVKAGDVLATFPGIWNQYGPLQGETWQEYWVLFDGYIPERYRRIGLLNPQQPVWHLGPDAPVGREWKRCHAIWKKGDRSPLELTADCFRLLTAVCASSKCQALPGDGRGEYVIHLAKMMEAQVFMPRFDVSAAIRDFPLGYTAIRRLFRQTMGVAPHVYFLSLKMREAKDQLAHSKTPIKGIAENLGFQSPYYFSRLFRQMIGLSPKDYRQSFF